MKAFDLRKKSENDLKKILKNQRKKLHQLRFNLAAGRLKNHQELKKIKREIARILTVFHEGKQ